MIRRWFQRSNRLAHEDAEVRLQAVRDLTPAQAAKAQDTLASMATSDATLEVRVAAVQFVESESVLQSLLDDEHLAPHCAALLIKRAANGPLNDAYAGHPAIVSAQLKQADPAELPALAAKLDDPKRVADLAMRARADGREDILNLPVFASEAGLNALEKASRGKDKHCNRFARTRLEALKSQRQQQTNLAERVAQIDNSIAKELKHNPQQAEQVIAHRTKLRKLGDERRTLVNELGSAATDFNIDTQDPLADIDLFVPAAGESAFDSLCDSLTDINQALYAGKDIEQQLALRSELASQWLTAADKFPPTKAQHDIFESSSKLCRNIEAAWNRYDEPSWREAAASTNQDLAWVKQWQRALKQLNWPKECTAPEPVSQVQAAIELTQSTIAADQAQQANQQSALKDALDKAEAAVATGQTKQAINQLKAARELAADLPSGSHANKRLNAISAQLNELRDWQKFATSPKREALVSEMQTLAESPLEPQAQSARIRNLREQWQALGAPASATDRSLGDAFDTAAESAYAVCRVYYQEQNEVRAENLVQRKQICTQLKNYLDTTDWASADLKAADSILRTARSTWREYHPCERKALKPVEAEFEALQDKLYQHLKAGWDKNINAKKALIEAAAALVEQPSAEQIEQAKQLQQQWRDVGPIPRGVDQRLWKDFRKHCDAVFARRDADRESARAEQQAHDEALEAAITALEQLVAQTPSPKAFSQANETIRDTRIQAKPSKAQLQRINDAQDTFNAQQTAAKLAAQSEHIEQLHTWDQALAQAEQTDQLDQVNAEQMDSLFSQRLKGQAETADWEHLVLVAEIAAQLPSPEAQQSQRMAIQVELMNDGIRSFDKGQLNQLLEDWCSSGPQPASIDPLRERFFTAIKAALAQAA